MVYHVLAGGGRKEGLPKEEPFCYYEKYACWISSLVQAREH